MGLRQGAGLRLPCEWSAASCLFNSSQNPTQVPQPECLRSPLPAAADRHRTHVSAEWHCLNAPLGGTAFLRHCVMVAAAALPGLPPALHIYRLARWSVLPGVTVPLGCLKLPSLTDMPPVLLSAAPSCTTRRG